MTERERFEKHYRNDRVLSIATHDQMLVKNSSGKYDNTAVQHLWEFWQAAKADQSAEVQGLIDAVKALPVKDWTQEDGRGGVELVGYIMQAQGEWDAVVQALQALERSGGDE